MINHPTTSEIFPLIYEPYAPFFTGERPDNWPQEVARRLKCHDILPTLPRGGFDDRELEQRLSIGIYTLTQRHLLMGLGIRLQELKSEIQQGRRPTRQIMQQIQRVQQALNTLDIQEQREKAARKSRLEKSGISPGDKHEGQFAFFGMRGFDYDPCDI